MEVKHLIQMNVVEGDISAIIEKYGDMVRRICFLYLRNRADVEDVFIAYFLNVNSFQNDQHQKAWLCRVTFNKCKDLKKSGGHKRIVSIENREIPFESKEQSDIMMAVLQLPEIYKELIYLHYYEGWTIPEIPKSTRQNENTVYSQLRRAKKKLN